jgi:hypothetical protein
MMYRSIVHEEILSMIYYSKGGFDWKQMYLDIPIQMRKFYIAKLTDILQKESESAKSTSQVPSAPTKPSIRPGVSRK